MLMVTTDTIPGKAITEVLGLAKGSTVQCKHIGKDIGASFKTIVGGELQGYNEMLVDARRIALERLEQEAAAMGANAIVGLRLMSSSVMSGAAEMVAYGTAVTIV